MLLYGWLYVNLQVFTINLNIRLTKIFQITVQSFPLETPCPLTAPLPQSVGARTAPATVTSVVKLSCLTFTGSCFTLRVRHCLQHDGGDSALILD